jgi:hypothetical protein
MSKSRPPSLLIWAQPFAPEPAPRKSSKASSDERRAQETPGAILRDERSTDAQPTRFIGAITFIQARIGRLFQKREERTLAGMGDRAQVQRRQSDGRSLSHRNADSIH